MSRPIFEQGVRLARHTTFRIGGPAAAFFTAKSSAQVVEAAWRAQGMGLPWIVIGHGSNLLVSDSGVGCAVIAFKEDNGLKLNESGTVTASGGCPLSAVVDFFAENGLGNIEDLAGIPGTLGGAICGNAGAYGTSIGGLVRSLLLLDRNGGVRRVSADQLSFSYRTSSVKASGEVILEAELTGEASERELIRKRIQRRLLDRVSKHPDPSVVGTAGSFFKNPCDGCGNRVAAGRLLEDAGCRGLSVGGARPWHSHANIIVTDGKAGSGEVLALAERMSGMVAERSGIRLEAEVVYLE